MYVHVFYASDLQTITTDFFDLDLHKDIIISLALVECSVKNLFCVFVNYVSKR